jgi:hypothetical protein
MAKRVYERRKEVYLVEFYGDYHYLATAKRLQNLLKSGELLGERVEIELEKLGKNWVVPTSTLDNLHSRFEEGGLGISPLQLEF